MESSAFCVFAPQTRPPPIQTNSRSAVQQAEYDILPRAVGTVEVVFELVELREMLRDVRRSMRILERGW